MLSVTIPGKTINELLQYWASTPDWSTPAFVSVDARGQVCSINRKELLEYAGRFAYKLLQLGVTKGSIICSTLPNSIERVICDMGIYLSGATSMNGQIFHSDGQDFFNSLRASQAQCVIVDPSVDKGPYNILKAEGMKIFEGCVNSVSLPYLRNIIFCQRSLQESNKDFIGSLQSPGLNQVCVSVDPSDIATIMTTSGSTGYSKLVRLTHANLCHFCVQVKVIEPLKEGDPFINCAPLGWAGGFPQWYLGCGVTRYFIDMYHGPPENVPLIVWQTIVRERIVYGFLSPMYVNEILRNYSWWYNSEWKPEILCLAGQPIKKGHLEIIGKLCSAVDINYGMTECNVVTTHRITDSVSFEDGCAGYPGHGVSLKIVDKDRNVLPQGTTGEILLQSPSLTLGYLNNDGANSGAFTSDGWFCTDDAGYIDSEGRVHVEGRQSDSIMRGAYILYPGWLEQEIKKIDKVKDVAVIAVPDPVLHNEICACIVTDCVKDLLPQQEQQGKGSRESICITNSSSSIPYSLIKEENRSRFDGVSKSHQNGLDKVGSYSGGSSHSGLCGQLENIRTRGMKKSLNVDYNATKVKGETAANVHVSNKSTYSLLQSLEVEIRHCCDQRQILTKQDAMRMTPKYYVFWDKFPVTVTGKLNRKEICQKAGIVLGLSS